MTAPDAKSGSALIDDEQERERMNPKVWLLGKRATVGAHVVAEKVRPAPARKREQVRASGAAITTDWLTDVLCRETPGAAVVSFSNPGGSSGTSERMALRVEYNE